MGSWYDNKFVVAALLLIFYPVGLFALWKGKSFSMMTKKILTVVFVIPIIAVFVTSSDIPAADHAQPYTIVDRSDFSFISRDRYSISIVSTQATNRLQFAHTAMKAAVDTQKETGADVVSVWLEPSIECQGSGLQYAIVNYAPDGKGLDGESSWKWEVEAAEKQLPPGELAISKLWWENRGDFQVDGLTDEHRLKAWIAQKLGIQESAVSLPFVSRKSVDI